MQLLEKEDIQGLIVRGYSNFPEASFVLCGITNPAKAKKYFARLAERITPASQKPDKRAIHIAFSNEGIKLLNLSSSAYATFSRQFKEGMTEKNRQLVLGDIEYNAPEHWEWGGTRSEQIHFILMIYAKDKTVLNLVMEGEKNNFDQTGIKEIKTLDSFALPEQKEHFGFRDGISQPNIEELGKDNNAPEWNVLPSGEFILGYKNVYDQYPESPFVSRNEDPENLLPASTLYDKKKDLGRNGSYLIFRQLSQDVHAFWKYLMENSNEKDDPTEAAICLGAKMVGRWPDGTPLIKSPDEPNDKFTTDNQFGYWKEDFHGLKCPVGSHIRRSNPRDWLLTEKTHEESMQMIRKHRILRRGRAYGLPMTDTLDPEKIMKAENDTEARGLHFICFSGDIIRQFEFIQNAWIRFPKFGGLYDDSDPLIGTHYQKNGIKTDAFTVPAEPVRRRYKNLPEFTTLRGGGYFFFPGIRALRYLASLPNPS